MRTVHASAGFWLAEAQDVRTEVIVAGGERAPVLAALAESLSGVMRATRDLWSQEAAALRGQVVKGRPALRLGVRRVEVNRWHTSAGRLVYALKSDPRASARDLSAQATVVVRPVTGHDPSSRWSETGRSSRRDGPVDGRRSTVERRFAN